MKVKLHYVHKLRAHKMKRMKVLFKYLSPQFSSSFMGIQSDMERSFFWNENNRGLYVGSSTSNFFT